MLTRKSDDAGLLPGFTTNAFLILDKNGRVLARGCSPASAVRGWCKIRAKRYWRDRDLVRKVEQLAGMEIGGVL